MFGRPQVPEEHRLPDLPVASVPRRIGAYALDVVVLAVVLMPVHALVFFVAWDQQRPDWLSTGARVWAWQWLTMSLPVWLYFSWCDANGRTTVGKRLLLLRVTSLTGDAVSTGRAFLRTVVKLAPWEMLHFALFIPTPMWEAGPDAATRPLLMVNPIFFGTWVGAALLTPKAQSVHDLIAGTLVLDARDRAPTSGDAPPVSEQGPDAPPTAG